MGDAVELPPRARRIPHPFGPVLRERGTTSACAENTWSMANKFDSAWNYLRVRGEYAGLFYKAMLSKELPPRARRIHDDLVDLAPRVGTTSACAENTLNELGLL